MTSTTTFKATCTPEEVGLSTIGLKEAFEKAMELKHVLSGQLLSGGTMFVARHGQVCFVDSFGMKDVSQPETKMTPDTLFNIASMTKTITSIGIMLLYQDKLLNLDDDVAKTFPCMAKENLKVGKIDGTTEPCERPITIRHLMTHTAGFSYGMLFQGGLKNHAQTEAFSFKFGYNKPEDFANTTLAFQPGTQFRYSQATNLLGLMIEKISGISLETFFQKRIFQPLGMIETSFNVQSNVSKLSIEQYGTNERSEKVNVIKVFHEIERGSPNVESLSLTNLSNLGRSPELGHGGLFSSPSDWWKLCQMLLNRGYPIMDVSTYSTMVEPNTPELNDHGGFISHRTDNPDTGGHFLFANFFPGGIAHNLTGECVISTNNIAGASIGTFGWEGIFTTKYTIDVQEDMCICFFSNTAPCWRYNFKGEILPLVYRSLLEPNVPHYEAFTNAKFAPTDTKWKLGDLIPSQHDIKKTSSKL